MALNESLFDRKAHKRVLKNPPQIYFPAARVIVKKLAGGKEGSLGYNLNSTGSEDLMTKLQALKVAFIEGLMRVQTSSVLQKKKKKKQSPTQEAFENMEERGVH